MFKVSFHSENFLTEWGLEKKVFSDFCEIFQGMISLLGFRGEKEILNYAFQDENECLKNDALLKN